MEIHPKWLPGRLGIFPFLTPSTLISTITGTGTTTVAIPTLYRKQGVASVSVQTTTTPPASGSALTVVFNLIRGSGGATIPLTAAFSILSLSANTATPIPLLTTLTDAQRIVQRGDVLQAVITAAGAIGTQPAPGIVFNVETFFLE